MKQNDIHTYDDIITMPHPISKKHPRMTVLNRAAQFAPFAALTGHKEAIVETERLTDTKRELDEDKKARLDATLQDIILHIKEHPMIKVTYFVEDDKKTGGSYVTCVTCLKQLDEVEQCLQFMDKTWIPLQDVYEIEILTTSPSNP